MLHDLSPYATLLPFTLILVVVFWQSKRLYFGRQFVSAVLIALVSFQGLFLLQGYVGIPDTDATEVELVLFTVALIFGFNAITQLLQSLFYEAVIRRRMVNIPNFIINLFGWAATFVVAIIVVRQVLGIELTGLIVTSTVASAIIALSFQEILSGLFAGLVMQVESPFALGDWVEVAGQEGTIEQLNWRTVAILTRSNNYVIFTNNEVASTKIINYSRPHRQQAIQACITVAYIHPPGRVKEVLLKALEGVDGVLTSPNPVALIIGYGDNGMNYLLSYWVQDFGAKNLIQDEVYSRFWYMLNRTGMGAPFGFVDVNLKSPEEGERAKVAQHERVVAFLRGLPLLASWNDVRIEQLAAASYLESFTTNEKLVRQGEEGDSLFIICNGSVGVFVEREPDRIRVATRVVGEYFGEMSLLTGEPRSATVIAESELDVVVIDKPHFVSVLAQDSTILETLLDVLEERQIDTQTQIAATEAQAQEALSARATLMRRIGKYFGISV